MTAPDTTMHCRIGLIAPVCDKQMYSIVPEFDDWWAKRRNLANAVTAVVDHPFSKRFELLQRLDNMARQYYALPSPSEALVQGTALSWRFAEQPLLLLPKNSIDERTTAYAAAQFTLGASSNPAFEKIAVYTLLFIVQLQMYLLKPETVSPPIPILRELAALVSDHEPASHMEPLLLSPHLSSVVFSTLVFSERMTLLPMPTKHLYRASYAVERSRLLRELSRNAPYNMCSRDQRRRLNAESNLAYSRAFAELSAYQFGRASDLAGVQSPRRAELYMAASEFINEALVLAPRSESYRTQKQLQDLQTTALGFATTGESAYSTKRLRIFSKSRSNRLVNAIEIETLTSLGATCSLIEHTTEAEYTIVFDSD